MTEIVIALQDIEQAIHTMTIIICLCCLAYLIIRRIE